MNSIEEYRVQAEDCLRIAQTAEDERDRSLWVTLAQSWLQLAEDATRIKSGQPLDRNEQSADTLLA